MINPFKIKQTFSEIRPSVSDFSSIKIICTSRGFDKTRKFMTKKEKAESTSLVIIDLTSGNCDSSFLDLMMNNLAERIALEEQ